MLKLFLPIVCVGMLAVAALHVARQKEPPQLLPPAPPSRSPFEESVSGAGIVEARTENISLGSALAGVVLEVYVPADRVGTRVKAGTPLFRIDDRHLKAQLAIHQASLGTAEAELAKLEAQPRPEELSVSEAKVRAAKARQEQARDQFDRARKLYLQGAGSQEDYRQRQMAFECTRQQLAQAEAEHALVKAGTWKYDRAIARAAVAKARAQVQQTQAELDRAVVCAPVEAEVLQVNVRRGEYVGTPATQPLVVLGDLSNLHIRVDIDDHDVPRFRRGAPARACLRGKPEVEIPLTFVRVEPFVLPKKSLTAEGAGRVDTRVLRVVFALPPEIKDVYVGQQLDVFIDAAGGQRTPSPPSAPSAG
jgi:HlyD family secretion protein